VLSRFVDQLLPEAIDRLGILPADWDRWPPRAAPFQRRVTQSRWMRGEWMSKAPVQSAVISRQSVMIDRARIDRALKESPLFQALRAGDLVIEAKRRDDRGRYSEVEILSPEVWRFEHLIIQKSPPLLSQRVRNGVWTHFATPVVRADAMGWTAEAQMAQALRKLKAERRITPSMSIKAMHRLVLTELRKDPEKEAGFGYEHFRKNVAARGRSN
jgi:hypothetical protein